MRYTKGLTVLKGAIKNYYRSLVTNDLHRVLQKYVKTFERSSSSSSENGEIDNNIIISDVFFVSEKISETATVVLYNITSTTAADVCCARSWPCYVVVGRVPRVLVNVVNVEGWSFRSGFRRRGGGRWGSCVWCTRSSGHVIDCECVFSASVSCVCVCVCACEEKLANFAVFFFRFGQKKR